MSSWTRYCEQSFGTLSWVRLTCGTADRGTAESAEQPELTEPKEMTVLLRLPLANMIN